MEKTLPRTAYVDQEWFDREVAAIFEAQWFAVGRVEEIPGPGDFLVVEVLGESILVARGHDGALRAFVNLCRHRGSRLSPATGKPAQPEVGPSGSFRGSIQCPYHAWTYSLDGRLRAAPYLDDEELNKSDLPLHAVGIETWAGFVWIHLGRDPAPSITDHLEDAPRYLASYPLADLRVTTRIVYQVEANWKAIVENYNECYHCGPVHPELVELVPLFKTKGGADVDWEAGVPHRAGAWTFTSTGTTNRQPFPGLTDEEKVRHKGQLIYPNLMLSVAADHVVAFTLFPQGPDATVIVCDFLFHVDEIGREGFDPDDAVSFWDVVNRQDWGICEQVQRGMSSRRFETGFYAPMEDYSMDIRRYIDRLM